MAWVGERWELREGSSALGVITYWGAGFRLFSLFSGLFVL